MKSSAKSTSRKLSPHRGTKPPKSKRGGLLFYHLTYQQPAQRHRKNSPQPIFHLHHVRDGDAFAEIQSLLHDHGHRYAGLKISIRDSSLDVDSFARGSLIVCTTRPPAPLKREKEFPSGTPIEIHLQKAVAKYLNLCARNTVVVREKMAKHLSVSNQDFAAVTFFQYATKQAKPLVSTAGCERFGTDYSDHIRKASDDERKTTVGFLFVQPLKTHSLVMAFSMDGSTTLGWCNILRTRLADLLRPPLTAERFVMCKITAGELPGPKLLCDLDSVTRNWKIEPLIVYSPDSHLEPMLARAFL